MSFHILGRSTDVQTTCNPQLLCPLLHSFSSSRKTWTRPSSTWVFFILTQYLKPTRNIHGSKMSTDWTILYRQEREENGGIKDAWDQKKDLRPTTTQWQQLEHLGWSTTHHQQRKTTGRRSKFGGSQEGHLWSIYVRNPWPSPTISSSLCKSDRNPR